MQAWEKKLMSKRSHLVRLYGESEAEAKRYLEYNDYIVTGRGVKVGLNIYQFKCKKLGLPLRDVTVIQ